MEEKREKELVCRRDKGEREKEEEKEIDIDRQRYVVIDIQRQANR